MTQWKSAKTFTLGRVWNSSQLQETGLATKPSMENRHLDKVDGRRAGSVQNRPLERPGLAGRNAILAERVRTDDDVLAQAFRGRDRLALGFGGIPAEHTRNIRSDSSVFLAGSGSRGYVLVSIHRGGSLRRILWLVSWAFVLESALLSMLVFAMVAGADVTRATAIIASIAAGAILLGAGLAAAGKQKVVSRINLWAIPISPLFTLLLNFELRSLAAFVVLCGAVVIPGFFWLLRHDAIGRRR